MGGFYGGYVVRCDDQKGVADSLKALAKREKAPFAVDAPKGRWINVLTDGDHTFNESLADEVAKAVGHDVFHIIVIDDDVLAYRFYRKGRLADEYNSLPDYFDDASDEDLARLAGNPDAYADLFAKPEQRKEFRGFLAGLSEQYVFASEALPELAKFLGLPDLTGNYDDALEQGGGAKTPGFIVVK